MYDALFETSFKFHIKIIRAVQLVERDGAGFGTKYLSNFSPLSAGLFQLGPK